MIQWPKARRAATIDDMTPDPRSPSRRAVLAAGAVAAAGTAFGCAPFGDEPGYRRGPLTIAAGVTDGVYYMYAEALARHLTRALSGVTPRVNATNGSEDNVAQVIDGTATFGFAEAPVLARTLASFTGHDLAGLAHIFDDYLHLVVTERSGISSVAELRGRHRRISVDLPGSGVELEARRVLSVLGWRAHRDYQPVHADLSNSIAMLRDGRIDAFFWSGGLPTAAITRLIGQSGPGAHPVPIRLLALGRLGERMVRRYGPYYRTSTIPNMMYPGTGAVSSLALPNYIITRREVDRGLAYHITKVIISARDAIATTVPAANQLDMHSAIQTGDLDLHPGAADYYRSIKP